MDAFLRKPCEEIDACVGSSDLLEDPAARTEFRSYVESWLRQIEALDAEVEG